MQFFDTVLIDYILFYHTCCFQTLTGFIVQTLDIIIFDLFLINSFSSNVVHLSSVVLMYDIFILWFKVSELRQYATGFFSS